MFTSRFLNYSVHGKIHCYCAQKPPEHAKDGTSKEEIEISSLYFE